ncbi:unnamed protein product [Trifolium pratense]|uniref:Uncharacterized protein n=1 Tax=Trifolium pratense TaxID=57577 RepID=A0ACB0IAS6_TRIPR|nr:unnamed protein product [Trifolium pratense]
MATKARRRTAATTGFNMAKTAYGMAGTIWNEGKCSIIEGEALALLEAMKAVKDIGITHAIFETDSKNVVDAIHNLRGVSTPFPASNFRPEHRFFRPGRKTAD